MIIQRQKQWKNKLNLSLVNLTNNKTNVEILPKSDIVNRGRMVIECYEYEQENLIGEGATSKVYLGRKSKDHRFLIAVKVVDKRKVSRDKQNFQLLKQEMEIHKDLDHPNIAKCYDIFEKNNHYYFILEYCPHGTLETFIKKFQTLSESVTANILEQIMCGYKYLMKQKIIHRDLKPPNILKAGYVWKICDFGFSVRGKKNLIGELNVGTPSYMAPESLQRNYYSSKTDFFSFGVICYEMLFGTPPWQHKNEKILLEMMLQQKLSPQNLSALTNKNITSFMLKCCEPNERKRMTPQEFQEFDFWRPIEVRQEIPKGSKEKWLNRTASQALCFKTDFNSSTNDVSISSNFSAIKGQRKESLQQTLLKNKLIIDKQLHYIKIIYQILKNIRQLSFQNPDDKQIFITVIHRHSLYMIRRIKISKFNYLCLKKWEEYIKNTVYGNQLQLANQLSYKLQNILKGENRRKTIVAIRIINRKFDELTYDKILSNRSIGNIKEYLQDFMSRNLSPEAGTESNIQKWVINFLYDYYAYISSYFDPFSVNSIKQPQKQLKVDENYANVVFSEESFSKISQGIRALKP